MIAQGLSWEKWKRIPPGSAVMKPTIDYYVENLANSVTPRQWVVLPLLVAAPLLFTGINRYFTGKDFFTNIGDYVQIGVEMAVLAGISRTGS